MTNLRLKLWHRPDASSNLVGFWDNLGDWSTSSWFFHEIWASTVLGTRNSLHWMHFAQSIHQRPATRRSVCVFCIVMMKGSAAHFLGHVEKYLSTDTKKILVNRSPVESWVRCNECNLQVGPTVVPPLGGDKCVAFHANRSRQRTYVQSKRHLTKVEKGL